MTVGGQQIKGPLENVNTLSDLINKIIPFMMGMAGLVLFFVFVMGGYDFLLSQGNADKIKSGKAKITAGIVGFVLLILSYLVARLLAFIFGVDSKII